MGATLAACFTVKGFGMSTSGWGNTGVVPAMTAGTTAAGLVIAITTGVEIGVDAEFAAGSEVGGVDLAFSAVVEICVDAELALAAAGVIDLAIVAVETKLVGVGDERFEKLKKDLGEVFTFDDESDELDFLITVEVSDKLAFFTIDDDDESDELVFLIVEVDVPVMETPLALALGGQTFLIDFSPLGIKIESDDLSVDEAAVTAFRFDLGKVAS